MPKISNALLAALCALALSAPVLAATPADTLVVAQNIDDIITLDPGEAFELIGLEVTANLYDRITMHEPEDLQKLVGGVAEGWEISADGHTITLKLRSGQTFVSGNPVTAHDLVFSLVRTVKLEKTPVFLLNQFGWTKDNVEKNVVAADDMTVKLTIPEALAPTLVLNVLSAGVGSVVDKKTVLEHEQNGDLGNAWLKANSAGSGAFKLVSWKPNEGVVMEANPHYRHGAPVLKRVLLRHVPEPAAQRLLIEKGDVDIARNLTADQVAGLAGNADVKVQTDPKATLLYLMLNMGDPVLSKPKVREALRYLVDYDGMTGSFLRGQFQTHQAFWPSGFAGSLGDKPFKLDVDKAKALLAEAGEANGFEVELDAFNSSPYADIAQSVQDTMARAGVKVKILAAEKKAVYTKHRSRQSKMTLTHWAPDYLDPHSNADAFASNPDNRDEAKLTGLITWRARWDAPETTKLVAAAKQETDGAKRDQMYLDLQRKLQADSPFIFLFQEVQQAVLRKNVDGFISGATSDLVFYRKTTKH
ncbi:MAG: ABC transporter substrate-binding protein [Gammaproteobacteria bacterium]